MRYRHILSEPWIFDDPNDGEEGSHSTRRRKSSASPRTALDEARRTWEPIVCERCGTRHHDTRSIRLRWTGRAVEARCSSCGAVTAIFADGCWTT